MTIFQRKKRLVYIDILIWSYRSLGFNIKMLTEERYLFLAWNNNNNNNNDSIIAVSCFKRSYHWFIISKIFFSYKRVYIYATLSFGNQWHWVEKLLTEFRNQYLRREERKDIWIWRGPLLIFCIIFNQLNILTHCRTFTNFS